MIVRKVFFVFKKFFLNDFQVFKFCVCFDYWDSFVLQVEGYIEFCVFWDKVFWVVDYMIFCVEVQIIFFQKEKEIN